MRRTTELEQILSDRPVSGLKKEITCFHPGMFRYNGRFGRYPAISVTGTACSLMCDHCRGILLRNMPDGSNERNLIDLCCRFDGDGCRGVLLTGGCREDGRMPWAELTETIGKIKRSTSLKISIHCRVLDRETTLRLKESGTDQVLIDLIGDPLILQRVFHMRPDPEPIRRTMEYLQMAGLDYVPHIIAGFEDGRIESEYSALGILQPFRPAAIVIAMLMPLSQTPMARFKPPPPQDFARLVASIRADFPDTPFTLGCARPRSRPEYEIIALAGGIDGITIPSDEALQWMGKQGTIVHWRPVCCSQIACGD